METQEFTHYSLGEPYVKGKTNWQERAIYEYRSRTHEFLIFFGGPREFEVAAVQEGEAEFALTVIGDVIFFLYRFGPEGEGIPWSDVPFSIHLVNEEERFPPEEGGDELHPLLTTVLIDASTGVVRALRLCTFSAEFGAALHQAIREQYDRGWCGNARYDIQIATAYANNTTAQLLERAEVRCHGGD